MNIENLAASCCDYCGKCPNNPNKCPGCNMETHPEYYFLKCCTQKAIDHCGLCSEFPCEKLASFIPDDRAECPKGYHMANLRRRVQIGTELWLEEQEKIWGIK